MVSLEQFHENLWKTFFSSKKTLEEALAVFENMSMESKALMSFMAFKKDKCKKGKDKNGEECIEFTADPEELEHFTLLCMQKEKEGYFNKELSEVEIFNLAFDNLLKEGNEK